MEFSRQENWRGLPFPSQGNPPNPGIESGPPALQADSLPSELPSDQFSCHSVCPTLGNPMNRSTPGLPVHHQLPEFRQTHVHQVGDAMQHHPLLSPSPPAPNPSQHQLFSNNSGYWHQVAKVLEFQL